MRFLLRKAAFLLVLLSVLGTGALARAATAEPPVLAEELTLPVGTVFEIYVDHDITEPIYNWTLLLDNTFLQAGRNQWFRTRLIQPGTYLLNSETHSPDGGKSYKKVLILRVQENVPPAASAGSGVLVRTTPATDEYGRIILTPGRNIVQFLPVTDSKEAFVLDLRKTVDSNGDGNAQNDQEAENTFFSEQHTPLNIWFAGALTRRIVTVSLRGRVGTEQEIAVVSPEQAAQEDTERVTELQRAEEERARILVTHFGSGAVKFSAYIEHETYRKDPLLLHWNFGDGKQSLLDAPIHVYAANNVYTVRVGLRNLRTGAEITALETAVDVRTVVEPATPVDPTEPGDTEEKPSSIPASFFTVLKYGVGILLAIAIGFFATLLIRFLRKKGGVSTLLARAEMTLADSEQKETEPNMQPMSLAIEEPQEQETHDAEPQLPVIDTTSEKTPAAKEEVEPAPDLATAQAPSWLQQGLEQATQSPVAEPIRKPAPSPLPAQTEEQVIQTPQEPAPEPLAPTPPQQGEDNGNIPSWLQQPAATPTEPAEAQEPEETQPAPIAPPIETAPAEPQTPAPEPIETANAPDWLQQGIRKAQQTGQTPSSPPPPALQETPLAQEPVPEPPASTPVPAKPVMQPKEEKPDATYHIPPEQWAAMTPEEREQELRRQKRRRYRQNRKMKEKTEKTAPAPAAPKETTPQEMPKEKPKESVAPISETPPPATAQTVAPAKEPTDIGEPILPAGGEEDAVKFVIGADSLNTPDSQTPKENNRKY